MKKIHMGVFEQFSINFMTMGMWTNPHHQGERYKTFDYWVEIAKILERGKFDFLFFADAYGYPEVSGNTPDVVFTEAIEFPKYDPTLLIPVLAHATKNLAYAVTASTSFELPYANARKYSTLDHLTNGRIAWNVVTSSNKVASDNLGKPLLPHAERYGNADEFMELSYKLWEGGWEDDAIVNDKEKRIYTDPRKVHKINHEGKYFTSSGYYYSEPSPQRTPVLFQAGSSARGRAFAAKNAECILLQAPTVPVLKEYVDDIRSKAMEYGRDPNYVKAFTGVSVIVAQTKEEVRQKQELYRKHRSTEAAIVNYAMITGLDLSKYSPDELFENVKYTEQGGQTHIDYYKKSGSTKTVRDVIEEHQETGMRSFLVAGTPDEVADQLQNIVEGSDIDGFFIEAYESPGSYADFVDLVVPELQKRNMYRQDYEEGETFRERLFGKGVKRLPDHHPGAGYRV